MIMKFHRIALCFSVFSVSFTYGTGSSKKHDSHLRASQAEVGSTSKLALIKSLFMDWKEEHDKIYDNPEEEAQSIHVWMANHEFIEKHNSKSPNPSYMLGHNQFSDMTNEEYKQYHFLGEYSPGIDTSKRDKKYAQEKLLLGVEVEDDSDDSSVVKKSPHYVNWVKKGAVTPVKNQGACGSCWAFSTTGALEGAHFLKTGGLVSLSEQQLLDCDTEDKACMGGIMDTAFEFDEEGRGMCTEEDYPYEAKKQSTCTKDCDPVADTLVSSFTDVKPGDYYDLKASIALQPTSIAIQADQVVFQFYKSGVLDNDDCGKAANIDHGVLAVGYGKDKKTGLAYWLVKNSWGETWGDEGYIKLARKSENTYGTCAILRLPSRPEVA